MATLGNTTAETGTDALPANQMEVSGPYTATQDGTITSVKLYLDGAYGGGASQVARGLVYLDSGGSPGALVCRGDEFTVNFGDTAQTFTSAATGTITNGSAYWIGLFGGSSTNVIGIRFATVANALAYLGATYPTAPNPFGTANAYTYKLGAYVEYTPSSSGIIALGAAETSSTTLGLHKTAVASLPCAGTSTAMFGLHKTAVDSLSCAETGAASFGLHKTAKVTLACAERSSASFGLTGGSGTTLLTRNLLGVGL